MVAASGAGVPVGRGGRGPWASNLDSESKYEVVDCFPPCPSGVLALLRDAYGKPTNEIGYETDGK